MKPENENTNNDPTGDAECTGPDLVVCEACDGEGLDPQGEAGCRHCDGSGSLPSDEAFRQFSDLC